MKKSLLSNCHLVNYSQQNGFMKNMRVNSNKKYKCQCSVRLQTKHQTLLIHFNF